MSCRFDSGSGYHVEPHRWSRRVTIVQRRPVQKLAALRREYWDLGFRLEYG
jgi:hypothetical protein